MASSLMASVPLLAHVRRWTIWTLPKRAAMVIVVVDLAYLAAVGPGLLITRFRAEDLATFGLLCGCGLLSIEGSLHFVWRYSSSDKTINDLLAVWTIPVALLLPPLYSLAVVIPFAGFVQVRLLKRGPMKVCFSVAAGGLAGFGASNLHAAIMNPAGAWTVNSLVGSAIALCATFAAVAFRYALNFGLVLWIVALTTPTARLRDSVRDGEMWGVVAAEGCTAILVAVACAAAPYAILLAIPPVLVLQRTLLLAGLREAARTDPKTGLANSSYWREVAERELARARGGSENLAVLLVDVDHFKSINDRFGHLTGDEVLRTVASGLTHGLRPHDLVGRFGGEEFVVLLVGSDLEQAQHAAERIRAHIATLDIDVLKKQEPVQVTVSVGVAAFRESGHSIHELLDAADGALYAAKHAGRNSVRTALGTGQQVLDLTDKEPFVVDLRTQPARVE